ncbi:MAG: glycosyltransferase family 2 protein [Thermoplasmata archaeon]|nr:glycosyltransferase family 2 protein [Candidatus Sysuiplasma jiujiangense]
MEFVMRAIESVSEQTLSRDFFEILVARNFSDDEIDRFAVNNGARLIGLPQCSIGEMMQLGLNDARGSLICFLDDDDLFSKDKLKRVYDTFSKFPDVGFYKHQFEYIDTAGNRLHRLTEERHISNFKGAEYFLIRDSEKLSKISQYSLIGPDMNISTMCIRKDVLSSVRNYLESVTFLSDTFLLAASLISPYSLFFDSASLSSYRVHSKSTSRQRRPYHSNPDMEMILEMMASRGKSEFAFFYRQKEAVGKIIALIEMQKSNRVEMIKLLFNFLSSKTLHDPKSELWAAKLAILYLFSPKAALRIKNR